MQVGVGPSYVTAGGIQGPQGVPGSGTALAGPSATLTASSTQGNGAFIALQLDSSVATQQTLTLGPTPTKGDSYFIKLINAMTEPWLLAGNGHQLEDPTNPGTVGAGPFALTEQGGTYWYQYDGAVFRRML